MGSALDKGHLEPSSGKRSEPCKRKICENPLDHILAKEGGQDKEGKVRSNVKSDPTPS
jgi:hypothetical protein